MIPVDYSRAVRILRAVHAVGQADLAKAVGCHESQVSREEGGTRGVSAERLCAYADYFGVTLDVLGLLAGRPFDDVLEQGPKLLAALHRGLPRAPDPDPAEETA